LFRVANDITEFRNKNVLITGAGRGLGKRLALGFARHGSRITLVSRSKSELDLAHIEIEQAGGNALRVVADVTNAEQLGVAVERAHIAFKSPVDVLICAAGIHGPLQSFLQSSLGAWGQALNVNLMGVVHACRAVLPHMVKRRVGKIIVLTCESDRPPSGHMSAYTVSKTALVRLVESFAVEVADDNVQINCLDPGRAYTTLTDEIIQAEEEMEASVVAEAREVRRTGGASAQRQLQQAMFLASEQSNHITGKLIHITDDWLKLRDATLRADALTLRRVQK
jgi:NAD(P)-dependent dehydrogenase (short-subunit alcohol dehydrogenase family)